MTIGNLELLSKLGRLVWLVVLSFILHAASRPAWGLVACTAADIIANDGSNCPAGSGPCTIKKDFDITSGCTLDFGARDVTVDNGSVLDCGSGIVTFRARNFTIGAGGYIDARGTTAPPNDLGGHVTIEATQAISLQKQSSAVGRLDAGGEGGGGSVVLRAGTDVSVAGRINVDGLTTGAQAGTIAIVAGGSFTSFTSSTISAAGSTGQPAGDVDISAGANVTLGDTINLDGGDGGTLEIFSRGNISLLAVSAKGTGTGITTDPGSGGAITIDGVGTLQVLGPITARGTSDGCGGDVTLSSIGNMTIGDSISVSSTLPYEGGGGGGVTLTSQGTLTIASTATISAHGEGRYGFGGSACLDGTLGVTVSGPIDAAGGGCGGNVDVNSSANVTVSARVDGSAISYGGVGGSANLFAGTDGKGTLALNNTIDVTGGPCSVEDGCGSAGSVFLESCDLTVALAAAINASAPDVGGQINFRAHEQLTIQGTVTALATDPDGFDGIIEFEHRIGRIPAITGSVQPAPTDVALPTCTGVVDPVGCLDPCPDCGNGVIEYPETCDMAGTPTNCDGCTRFCRVENCDDHNDCTIDSCDSILGCTHVLDSPCNTPTATPAGPTATPSRTRTVTPTPSISVTPTNTPTPTISPTPTETPTPTTTPTPTISPTATPTRTSTETPSRTPTSSPSVTPTVTPVVSATPSPTTSSTPASRHDTVLIPPHPVSVRLSPGTGTAHKVVKVKVRNADISPSAESPGHEVQVIASDGTCPPGTVAGLADFDRRMLGAQDSILVPGGRSLTASIPLAIAASEFQSFNFYSPQRCAIELRADVTSSGNADPSPSNNVATLEINVIDMNDTDRTSVHQSYVVSPGLVRLKIGHGASSVTKSVKVRVGNSDLLDAAGHGVTLSAADGSCPPGTVGAVDFDGGSAGAQPLAAVDALSTRAGSLSITLQAASVDSPSKKSPSRCTAVLTASGPSGDLDATNDKAELVIDVVDQNDL